MRLIKQGVLAVLWVLIFSAVQGGSFSSRFVFAQRHLADSLLQQNDDYIKGMSVFDLEARVQKKKATQSELMKNITVHILDWTPEEINHVREAVQHIEQETVAKGYVLHLPPVIYVIKSTMKNEGGADGYTRGQCIVLNDHDILTPSKTLDQLVLHELFHILTRYHSDFREKMYATIGFSMMNEVAYPDQLKDRKISNPDAAKKDSYIQLHINGETVPCMMILYADKDYNGGSFFDYIQIGMIKLEGNEVKRIALENGQPKVYRLDEVPDLFQQMGMNTPYIIDPEEVLAENFVLAYDTPADLASPQIVAAIKQVLKK